MVVEAYFTRKDMFFCSPGKSLGAIAEYPTAGYSVTRLRSQNLFIALEVY